MDKRLVAIGVILVAIAAAIAVFTSGTSGGTTTTSVQGSGVVLRGSGATFPAAQYDKWFSDFQGETGIVVEYKPVGSGQGLQDFMNGLVDFAGSDPPMPSGLWKKAVEKYGGVLQVPTIAGAIVVVYNLPGFEGRLNLTGEVLARIFMGEIRYWDDPAIKALNPSANLPHEEIVPVYRSDSSGTTQYFTYYLSRSCRAWQEKYGYGKVWPVKGVGVGANGNPGVASTVKNTPYSIGYVEYAYALEYGLRIAALSPPGCNDVFLTPTPESIEATLSKVAEKLPRPDEDWSKTFGLTIDAASEAESYPLVAYTHIVLRKNYNDRAKCDALRQLLEWLYKANVEKIDIVKGYFPLPKAMAEKLLEAAEMLCG